MDSKPQSLAAIFIDYRAVMLRFAKARFHGANDAEDVIQDIWLKLGDLEPARPVRDPLAYLFRITENAILDRIRGEFRRRRREASWMENSPASPLQGQGETSPEKIAIERDRLRRIERHIAQLPDRTRYIFHAFRVNGRQQDDIASELSISISAVEKHLQRTYKLIAVVQREDDASAGSLTSTRLRLAQE